MGKVLIFQNNSNESERLNTELMSAGYMVASVDDIHQMENRAREIQPDIVILDIDGLSNEGIETCRMMTNDNSPARHIIILSERNNLATKLSYLVAGAKKYVSKPLTPHNLLCEMEKLLNPDGNVADLSNGGRVRPSTA